MRDLRQSFARQAGLGSEAAMISAGGPAHPWADAWAVLTIFLIPFGGGIPAGVLLAKAKGFAWPLMVILYFISDVILACLFEPMMKFFIFVGQRWSPLMRMIEFFKLAVRRSAERYGAKSSVFTLVMISFGIDPMTGRAAARAAGHGFVTGWMIAIAGDMIFFTLIMVSTLWLSNVLGDGTSATLIILAIMILGPAIVRRVRARFWPPRPQP